MFLRPVVRVLFVKQFEDIERQLTTPGARAIRIQDGVLFQLPRKKPDSLGMATRASVSSDRGVCLTSALFQSGSNATGVGARSDEPATVDVALPGRAVSRIASSCPIIRASVSSHPRFRVFVSAAWPRLLAALDRPRRSVPATVAHPSSRRRRAFGAGKSSTSPRLARERSIPSTISASRFIRRTFTRALRYVLDQRNSQN